MKSTEMEFWDSRYRAGKMPWDFHGAPQALTAWLQGAQPAGRVFEEGNAQ